MRRNELHCRPSRSPLWACVFILTGCAHSAAGVGGAPVPQGTTVSRLMSGARYGDAIFTRVGSIVRKTERNGLTALVDTVVSLREVPGRFQITTQDSTDLVKLRVDFARVKANAGIRVDEAASFGLRFFEVPPSVEFSQQLRARFARDTALQNAVAEGAKVRLVQAIAVVYAYEGSEQTKATASITVQAVPSGALEINSGAIGGWTLKVDQAVVAYRLARVCLDKQTRKPMRYIVDYPGQSGGCPTTEFEL